MGPRKGKSVTQDPAMCGDGGSVGGLGSDRRVEDGDRSGDGFRST